MGILGSFNLFHFVNSVSSSPSSISLCGGRDHTLNLPSAFEKCKSIKTMRNLLEKACYRGYRLHVTCLAYMYVIYLQFYD